MSRIHRIRKLEARIPDGDNLPLRLIVQAPDPDGTLACEDLGWGPDFGGILDGAELLSMVDEVETWRLASGKLFKARLWVVGFAGLE
jgi:hypothetical protein